MTLWRIPYLKILRTVVVILNASETRLFEIRAWLKKQGIEFEEFAKISGKLNRAEANLRKIVLLPTLLIVRPPPFNITNRDEALRAIEYVGGSLDHSARILSDLRDKVSETDAKIIDDTIVIILDAISELEDYYHQLVAFL